MLRFTVESGRWCCNKFWAEQFLLSSPRIVPFAGHKLINGKIITRPLFMKSHTLTDSNKVLADVSVKHPFLLTSAKTFSSHNVQYS